MMKSLLLLAIFLPSVFTLLSSARFQKIVLSVYYPNCPSGLKGLMECDYSVSLKVSLETKIQPTAVSPTKPTTTTKQPISEVTAVPTTTSTTKPTTTSTSKPTTTTKQPTTTTTTKPTTTSTTKPTTTTKQPTTIPAITGCGIYPVQGFIFGAKVTTKCQPWLGYVKVFGRIRGSVILINEDTVLAIQSGLPLYIKDSRGRWLPSTFYFGNKSVDSTFTVKNTFETEVVVDDGPTQRRTFVVIKLDKKVTISGCVRPICLPTSEDDYHEVGCRAAIYTRDEDGNPQIKMGYTRLIHDSTCNSAVNNTLCAYPFVQTCTGLYENGGMLICPNKSGSRWMLVGLTRDDGCTPKKWNEPVRYWNFPSLGKT